ncbi:DUF2784 domain-containing protein [Amycolatopsis sp. CA-230715]|uniref:DUF2784 domain-containing protein n=1 Tax=Amycolatopsis sp. CA-230715 TaxID=2745196 RepID=UPI001C00CCDF|nr:DUF2784 domain-containing protein [Amycolatopsis sp. CA-230715]QWF80751.1 hypothetical protein HUW46_04175 [Amycolatopsis sp. CA-230715]
MYRFLADLTVLVHLLALAYIGFGGFLAWRWPKAIFVHIFFAVWGVAVNAFPIPCPLTALENFFRHQQGLPDLPGGFNAYYLYDTVFPRAWLPLITVVALGVVVISYIGAFQRWRRVQHGEHVPGPPVGLG